MAVTTFETVSFPEEGVRGVQVVFKDEDDAAVTPNADTIKWTLTDNPPIGTTATIINSREQVAITSASTITIVLEGDDLAFQASEASQHYAERVLLVEYQYDGTIGNNLDDKAQYQFKIENLKYTT